MDDPLLTFAPAFPLLLLVIGGGFIWWTSRMRFPAEVESEVLEALSDHQPLPLRVICHRVAGQGVDARTVASALEHLRRTGRAVRWYDRHAEQDIVYRRVA